MLAESLGVSIPTVSRCVTALRERGYDIRAERRARGWRFVLEAKQGTRVRHGHRPAPRTENEPALGSQPERP
jgi:hypothetical protein